MQNKHGFILNAVPGGLTVLSVLALCACAGTNSMTERGQIETPTVDYVESLDVYSAPHRDSFLNQLAMNYRSYAIYNARTSGYSEMGELFAQKAVAAFSGDLPFPETLSNWPVSDADAGELQNAYDELMEYLRADASYENPEIAAEAQAKYDCWLSALASGQYATADECRARYQKTMIALRECTGARIVEKTPQQQPAQIIAAIDSGDVPVADEYYPETRNMTSVRSAGRSRDGVIIVNNVNIPDTLVKTEPVQPLVFNQNIYGGDKSITNSNNNNGNFTGTTTDCPIAQQQAGQCSCQQRNDAGSCVSPVIVNEVQGATPQNPQPLIVIQEKSQTPVSQADQETIRHIQELQAQIAELQAMLANSDSVRQIYDLQSQIEQLQKQIAELQASMNTPVNIIDDRPIFVEEHIHHLPNATEEPTPQFVEVPVMNDNLVTREEFVDMMLAMRSELANINNRLEQINTGKSDKTTIKVQQIPLEPKQHVMEEIFEVRFDFDKSDIKPEYQDVIRQLASATQSNKNIKVSVIGHTDTSGSHAYNYALGGRRAEAVQKMLIQNGIPATQIVAVSSGEMDLKVPTPDGTPSEDNRRVRVIKETHFQNDGNNSAVALEVNGGEYK